MKEKFLSEANILKIKECLQLELLKRGITAPITSIQEVATPSKNYVAFETENFQTVPVMFKTLKVNQFNSSIIKKNTDDGREYFFVYISANYSYTHFDGGSNGCTLFDITFKVFGESEYDIHLSKIN